MCTKMAQVQVQVQILWGCFILWNLYISSAQAIYPGIKARATQRALDYGELDAFISQAVLTTQVESLTQIQKFILGYLTTETSSTVG